MLAGSVFFFCDPAILAQFSGHGIAGSLDYFSKKIAGSQENFFAGLQDRNINFGLPQAKKIVLYWFS